MWGRRERVGGAESGEVREGEREGAVGNGGEVREGEREGAVGNGEGEAERAGEGERY